MMYAILDPFKIKTTQGEIQLEAGQVITSQEDKAIRLFSEGKLKPFCYWLKTIVEDCQLPCFEISASKVLHECSHFKAYWNNKKKGEEIKRNAE